MEGSELNEVLREVIREEINEVVMKAKQYMGGTWNDTLRIPIEHLFSDVGVKQIDAKRGEDGSQIKVLLNNGDSIRGVASNSPVSGMVVVNGKFKRNLNGREAIMLVQSMRTVWEEYRDAAQG